MTIAAECSNVLLLRCYTRRAVYTCTAHTLVRVHTYSCKLVTDAGRDARFSFTFVSISNRLRFSDSCRTHVSHLRRNAACACRMPKRGSVKERCCGRGGGSL